MNTIRAILLVGLGCSIWACNNPNKNDPQEYQDPYAQYDEPYTSDPYASSGGTSGDPYYSQGASQDYQTTETMTPVEPIYTADPTPHGTSAMPLTGSRTHTVTKGDTLYRLARHYYSDQARWKDIYEANRDKLTSPDRILVGQKLLIP